MPTRPRRALLCALTLLSLTACAGATTPAAPNTSASSSPAASASVAASAASASATAPSASPAAWTFPEGSTVAGVDVSGKTPANAVKFVSLGLARTQQPLPLTLDAASPAADTPAISPAEVGLASDVPALVAEAEELARADKPVAVEWTPELDEAKLRAAVESLAPAFEQLAATDILTDEKAITSTFTFRAREGVALDVDATAARLAPLLLDRSEPLTETVVLSTTTPERGDLAQLKSVLEQHLTYWKGTGAIYVHDLETGQEIGINQDTVFSGASVMKMPIMIYVYSKLGKLDEQQREWMQGMIIDSDNLDANALLAAAAGGVGTEKALDGVNEMSEMLEGLGLKQTYQLIPYESGQWLIQQSRLPKGGPARAGEPPYTAPDPYVRTTPREMGQLFVMLAECADGKGMLLEKFSETISEALCDEMMGWLEQPHDEERMVAGIPAGVKVAHKGGWIDDMQSDVGIVSSPNGRYVAAIYIWRPGGKYVTDEHASPSPYLGDFSHTIYTFFNPAPIE